MVSFVISKLQFYGNYVLEKWIAVVGYEGVTVALAILVLTTIFVVNYKRWTIDVIVLCTILESKPAKRKYIIQMDVLPIGKASEMKKERKKKGFISKATNFIGGGKSAVFKVKTSSIIGIEIEGALKPVRQFKKGQNELQCTNIHKEVISRQIHLVPNVSSSGDDSAAITFTHDAEFLYQITITDILQEETAVKTLMSAKSNVLHYSGSAGSVDNLVFPSLPLPQGRTADDDIVSVRTGQRDADGDDDNDDDDYDDDDGHDESDGLMQRSPSLRSLESGGSSSLDPANTCIGQKVLSSRSLMTLSDTLGSKDAKRLLKQLNMTDAEITFEFDNHPLDSACACANLFNKWRSKEIHRGESYMCQELNRGLERINRNDIRAVFARCATENAELTAEDFHGICG